jgi:hypothetical protein
MMMVVVCEPMVPSDTGGVLYAVAGPDLERMIAVRGIQHRPTDPSQESVRPRAGGRSHTILEGLQPNDCVAG